MAVNRLQPRGVDSATPTIDDVVESYAADTAANIASIQAIDFRAYRGMEVVLRSGSLATLSVYTSPTESGTFGKKKDSAGSDIEYTVAANVPQEISPDLFGSRFVKLVGDVAGVLDVSLKG